MNESSSDRTSAERITFAISLLILIAVLAMAVWSNHRVGSEPAAIQVQAQLDDVRENDGLFYVPITITNTGGKTVEAVMVTGELVLGDGNSEIGEVTIDFLAGGEQEAAELIFSTDPSEGDLTVRPTSYLQP